MCSGNGLRNQSGSWTALGRSWPTLGSKNASYAKIIFLDPLMRILMTKSFFSILLPLQYPRDTVRPNRFRASLAPNSVPLFELTLLYQLQDVLCTLSAGQEKPKKTCKNKNNQQQQQPMKQKERTRNNSHHYLVLP